MFRPGSIWCFAFLLAFLTMYALKRNIPAFVALTVAALPALSYTRGFFFYNSVVALLGLGLGLWYVRSPKEWSKLWNNQLLRWFFIIMTVYWLISVILTGQYYANLRGMEMVCACGQYLSVSAAPKVSGISASWSEYFKFFGCHWNDWTGRAFGNG